MNWLEFLSQNWYVIVVVLVLLFGIYYTITNKQKALEWLKWCVTMAENELGKSTGQLKLRMVYDMFIEKFPVFSSIIPFNIFSKCAGGTIVGLFVSLLIYLYVISLIHLDISFTDLEPI